MLSTTLWLGILIGIGTVIGVGALFVVVIGSAVCFSAKFWSR
jgi:hypothetical protein